jgi:hypothetical protein
MLSLCTIIFLGYLIRYRLVIFFMVKHFHETIRAINTTYHRLYLELDLQVHLGFMRTRVQ